MTYQKNSFIFLFFFFWVTQGFASVRISQIDASTLLLNQKIRLYISVTDQKGSPVLGLEPKKFQILESATGKKYQKSTQPFLFKAGSNYEEGIHFLLLLDNSGSMYRTIEGKKAKTKEETRIYQAKSAIRTVLKSIANPKDKIGLVVYNSFYTPLSTLTSDLAEIERGLLSIQYPKKGSYSEIYSSLWLASKEFTKRSGRKAIIILSDGENSPHFVSTQKPHPVFGKKYFSYQKSIQALQKEGASVYVVHFGNNRQDRHLKKIAQKTGGAFFKATNQIELASVYSRIVDQILNEYVITYPASMDYSQQKHVRVVYQEGNRKKYVTRSYFSSTVFGKPLKELHFWIFIPFLVAILGLWGLSKIKFEFVHKSASLETLSHSDKNFAPTLLSLGEGKTVIGSSSSANLKLARTGEIHDQHATVIFNEKNKSYTLVGQGDLTINNKPVTQKSLESGDVITIDGITIVFDEGEKK
ncbi:MAG: Ca-activated chloride channel family protein [bacterium]|jgi:Ca-activated chloride channel family protein